MTRRFRLPLDGQFLTIRAHKVQQRQIDSVRSVENNLEYIENKND